MSNRIVAGRPPAPTGAEASPSATRLHSRPSSEQAGRGGRKQAPNPTPTREAARTKAAWASKPASGIAVHAAARRAASTQVLRTVDVSRRNLSGSLVRAGPEPGASPEPGPSGGGPPRPDSGDSGSAPPRDRGGRCAGPSARGRRGHPDPFVPPRFPCAPGRSAASRRGAPRVPRPGPVRAFPDRAGGDTRFQLPARFAASAVLANPGRRELATARTSTTSATRCSVKVSRKVRTVAAS